MVALRVVLCVFERLFTASRVEEPALLVVALLFTSPLRVPELTGPRVEEELLVLLFALADLETFPLLLLEFPGV